MTKEVSVKEMIKLLKTNGFYLLRSTGGHQIYSNGTRSVSIPVHNKTINRMLSRRLIKENNLRIN